MERQQAQTQSLSQRQLYSVELLRLSTLELDAYVRELAQERGLNCSKLLEEAILDTVGIRPVSQSARGDL